MRLPRLEHPERYGGLYVVDFGATCGVGYTGDEVAMLLESEAYAGVKVYRIHGASTDGTLELVGVPRERFLLEAGLMFYSRGLDAARADYDRLRRLAESVRLPCRAQLFLGELPAPARLRFVVGLAYPAEYDRDVSCWMLQQDAGFGEYADGGVGRLEEIRRQGRILDSCQLPAVQSSRSREEVFATVGQPVQRVA